MEITIAKPGDINKLTPVLLKLRPHLNPASLYDDYLQQAKEGFQLIYIEIENTVVALAGFRTMHFFFSGKTLYIDDLITHPNHLKHGYAGKLIDWIKTYAKENNYDHLSLDSGFQRKDAYRLYLNKGLEVESLHFGKKVKEL